MIGPEAISVLKRYVPQGLSQGIQSTLQRFGMWDQPLLTERGVINDLYYWVADGHLDTLLPLQNYFSVFFPDLKTETRGTLFLYSCHGQKIGEIPFTLGANALYRLRVSDALQRLGAKVPEGYGTLLCDLHIPEEVLRFLNPKEPFYFWDRFYIGYLSPENQPCFVHGVDKTYILHSGRRELVPFYPTGKGYTWLPEIPVNIELYRRLWVILINRTRTSRRLTLTVSDRQDACRSWSHQIPPFGVHRFELDRTHTRGLDPEEMRLKVEGIPSRWGRPILFKQFPSGAISAMHC